MVSFSFWSKVPTLVKSRVDAELQKKTKSLRRLYKDYIKAMDSLCTSNKSTMIKTIRKYLFQYSL